MLKRDGTIVDRASPLVYTWGFALSSYQQDWVQASIWLSVHGLYPNMNFTDIATFLVTIFERKWITSAGK